MNQGTISSAFKTRGKIGSLYVYFRDGVKIKECVKIFCPEMGGRILIYVGEDGYPVCLQVVDPMDRPSDSNTGQYTQKHAEFAKDHLRMIAVKMIAFVEAARQDLGAELIQDAIDTAKQVESEDACGAA